jgi:DNA-binding transcriptional LysR family regulator
LGDNAFMTPDQLRTFAIVALHRNISKAAAELHLSQPAVSGQLRLLAESLGAPLYHRHGRGITLTAAGEQLLVHAERVRVAYEKCVGLREALSIGQGGVLRVGASSTPASYLLPYLVAKFQSSYPHVQVAMRSGSTAVVAEHLNELDVAFIEGAVPANLPVDTVVVPWLTDQIVAIAPPHHPLTRARAPMALKAIAEYPLVHREAGSGMRRMIDQIFDSHDIRMNVAIDLASIEGVKEAVRAGMGIGFVSAMSMRNGDSTLAVLPLAEEVEFRRQFRILIMHHDVATSVCRAFVDLAMDVSEWGARSIEFSDDFH